MSIPGFLCATVFLVVLLLPPAVNAFSSPAADVHLQLTTDPLLSPGVYFQLDDQIIGPVGSANPNYEVAVPGSLTFHQLSVLNVTGTSGGGLFRFLSWTGDTGIGGCNHTATSVQVTTGATLIGNLTVVTAHFVPVPAIEVRFLPSNDSYADPQSLCFEKTVSSESLLHLYPDANFIRRVDGLHEIAANSQFPVSVVTNREGVGVSVGFESPAKYSCSPSTGATKTDSWGIPAFDTHCSVGMTGDPATVRSGLYNFTLTATAQSGERSSVHVPVRVVSAVAASSTTSSSAVPIESPFNQLGLPSLFSVFSGVFVAVLVAFVAVVAFFVFQLGRMRRRK